MQVQYFLYTKYFVYFLSKFYNFLFESKMKHKHTKKGVAIATPLTLTIENLLFLHNFDHLFLHCLVAQIASDNRTVGSKQNDMGDSLNTV